MTVRLDPLTYLPEEMALGILTFLPIPEIARCAEVCKKWRRLASDNSLWEKMLPKAILEPGMNLREHVLKRVAKSPDEILAKMKGLVSGVQPNQGAKFVCFFLLIRTLKW
ncbi:F-box protein [Parachlamydia acanthamoebae]|uniref:F-box domain-containing protein n=1 Tax=Parachlamydia acanthamoebae TaxID=83552 RepID=A0A0C1EPY7_9BACT|nr:F-box protein [Parachlamydia acanthamoebae]KIA78304.1 hypothetical protein DB43_EI00490 [Parachlamydia acanthamoebae]